MSERANPAQSTRQHRIHDPAPIKGWQMTQGSPGTWLFSLVGRKVVTAYQIPEEDDDGFLLLLDDGTVIGFGVDIGHSDDMVNRDPSKHEIYMYDATGTPAGKAIKDLEPGEWT